MHPYQPQKIVVDSEVFATTLYNQSISKISQNSTFNCQPPRISKRNIQFHT